MTTRRGFLGAILAAGVAPAAVASGVLMPVRPSIWTPNLILPGMFTMSPESIAAWTRALEREVTKPSFFDSHLKSLEFYDWVLWVGVDLAAGTDQGRLVTSRRGRVVSVTDL